MSHAEADFEAAQDRGWHSIDAFVCVDCVEDPYLTGLIRDNASSKSCDFCGKKRARQRIAAPVDIVTDAVATAMRTHFADPAVAGVPYESAEGGYQWSTFDTDEALRRLSFDAHEDLFEAISNAFTNTLWADAPGGHYLGSTRHEVLGDAWYHLVQTVKHESRYFFGAAGQYIAPEIQEFDEPDFLESLADMARQSQIKQLALNTSFFRVRHWPADPGWLADASTMGAPPNELASAGRMNPAGISYLYLAFEEETAVAEIFKGPPAKLAMARFKSTRQLTVLDLSQLPDRPSIFDDAHQHEREAVLFLESFAEAIAAPVSKDGREHIDYVPSQVVTEYFRLIFQITDQSETPRLDGIVYPSAVRPGGKNLVLFPTKLVFEREFAQVSFDIAYETPILTWQDLQALIR